MYLVILAYSVPSLKKGKNSSLFLRLMKVNTSSKKSSYIFTRKYLAFVRPFLCVIRKYFADNQKLKPSYFPP